MTWATTTQTWDDPVVGARTWDTAYDTIALSLTVGETLDLQESAASSFGRQVAEALAFSEVAGRSIARNIDETLTVGEAFSRVAAFSRAIAENIAIAESVGKTFGLQKAEVLAIVDRWRRQADLVLSDVLVSSTEMTLNDFAALLEAGSAPGFEEWRDFSGGDYEYREAMFRIVLQAASEDRGLISSLETAVDVPDVTDRGSATVVNATDGVVVTYARIFHVTPEVTMTSKTGIGGNPVAAEFKTLPTKTGFVARLRDTVTGSYVTGSLSWQATGY